MRSVVYSDCLRSRLYKPFFDLIASCIVYCCVQKFNQMWIVRTNRVWGVRYLPTGFDLSAIQGKMLEIFTLYYF